MSKYLSHKLTIIYTILIIMVVYIHSYYLEAEQYTVATFIQKVTGGICRVANCLFFSVSGYLFAYSIGNFKGALNKQKKRFRTLIPPYLLWNIVFILWYIALEWLPGMDRWVNGGGTIERFMNQSVWDSFVSLFVSPAAFQLWFLRDLLVMILFAPLLWLWTKKHWLSALVIALVSSLIYGWLVYFWMGIILATRKVDLEDYPRSKYLVIAGFGLFIAQTVFVALGEEIHQTAEIIINLIGVYVVWAFYDIFARGRCLADRGLWKYICGYSFFIYCFHEPTFNIIKKLPVAIFGSSEPILIFFYYLNPWLMIAVAIVIARLMRRFTPYIYKILTGGR